MKPRDTPIILAISISQSSSSTMGFSGQHLQPKTQFSVGTKLQKLCCTIVPQTCFPLSKGPALAMSSLCMDYASYLKMKTPVQFSCSIILDSLRLHGLQHARLPCPSPTPRASIQFSHSVVSNSMQPHGLQQASLPVYHQLPEFTQIHVHQIGDTI